MRGTTTRAPLAFWLVWNPESGKTCAHSSPEFAEEEAFRLAALNSDQSFVVLRSTCHFSSGGGRRFEHVDVHADDLPV